MSAWYGSILTITPGVSVNTEDKYKTAMMVLERELYGCFEVEILKDIQKYVKELKILSMVETSEED